MKSVIRAGIVAVLLAGALAAQPKATFTPHRFAPDEGETVDAELGEIKVPEDRSKPDSRMITLRFVRFRSTAAKPGYPIVYLAGGPGGSGIGAARGARFPLFLALREHGDVIAFDQRGTGRSEPRMTCDEQYMIDLGRPLTRESVGAGLGAAVARCAGKLRAEGVNLAAYNTRESAEDLNDLRKALGADRIVLWGISYGTHLSVAALRNFGPFIDRVILAGIEGPDETYKLPGDQQSLLEEIARLAWKDPAARERIPDLLASIARISAELEARPKSVTLTHPVNGMTAALALGKLDFQFALANMLQGPETFAGIVDFVARVERGDWTTLALAAAQLRIGQVPSLMSVAMDCASGSTAARRRAIEDEAQRTLLGDAINLPFPEVCGGVGIPDLGDSFRAPLRSEVPALLISGTLDGRTRPRQAEELRVGMPNARHLVIEGAGHSDPLFLSSPKILEAMKAFLRGEELSERYLVLPPVRFAPVREVANVPPEQLKRFAGEYRMNEKTVRKIVLAGSLLYSIRSDNQRPFVLRPSSETEFFFEESPSRIRFELEQGNVTGLVMTTDDGKEIRSPRIE